MLIEGLDEIGLTEQSLNLIEDFEHRDQLRRPWAYLSRPALSVFSMPRSIKAAI